MLVFTISLPASTPAFPKQPRQMLLQLIPQRVEFAQPGLRLRVSSLDLEFQQFLRQRMHLLMQGGDDPQGGLRTPTGQTLSFQPLAEPA